MTKVKRIIAFAMAMIVCVSFCCYSIGAEYAYFYGSLVQKNFSDTGAYAALNITNWSYDTDLWASTIAYVEDYDYMDGFFDLTVYVDLYVQMEDEFTINSSSSYEDTSSGDTELEACVYGSDCIDSVDEYGIIDFGSDHEVIITIYVFDDMYGNSGYVDINDGEVIHIIPG